MRPSFRSSAGASRAPYCLAVAMAVTALTCADNKILPSPPPDLRSGELDSILQQVILDDSLNLRRVCATSHSYLPPVGWKHIPISDSLWQWFDRQSATLNSWKVPSNLIEVRSPVPERPDLPSGLLPIVVSDSCSSTAPEEDPPGLSTNERVQLWEWRFTRSISPPLVFPDRQRVLLSVHYPIHGQSFTLYSRERNRWIVSWSTMITY